MVKKNLRNGKRVACNHRDMEVREVAKNEGNLKVRREEL